MSFSLIVPAAADHEIFDREMPPVFTLNKEGIMYCIKAIMGLDLDKFDAIYFTILAKHANRYHISELFELQFNRLGLSQARVVVLDNSTANQAETIFRTIEMMQLSGAIFIKDADSYFACDVLPENSVVTYPLESLNRVNPQHKSYVAVDDMFYVTNIIEKRIISHLFNAGGYVFENADSFGRYYLQLAGQPGLYLSHIITPCFSTSISSAPLRPKIMWTLNLKFRVWLQYWYRYIIPLSIFVSVWTVLQPRPTRIFRSFW